MIIIIKFKSLGQISHLRIQEKSLYKIGYISNNTTLT